MILGGVELAAIVGLAVLLFGANRIPKTARAVGKSMGEFRRGRREPAAAEQEVTHDN